MKYVGLLLTSVECFTYSSKFYYNSITLDMQRIEDYVMETNLILEDVAEKRVMYLMKRRLHIKVNACKERNRKFKTSFLIERYKEYKIKSIESLIYTISEEKKIIWMKLIDTINLVKRNK